MPGPAQSETAEHGARRMSVTEWENLPEEDIGELQRGVLVEDEMPSYVHEAVVAWLMGVLLPWSRAHGARVIGSGLKYALANDTGRMPDLSVFLRGSARPPVRGAMRSPPSIAVEVVSATPADARRDRIIKLSEYAAFGVAWYWIVDPELRSFEVLERDTLGKYVHVVSVTGGSIEQIPGCDGLAIDVDALWRELDAAIAESGTD